MLPSEAWAPSRMTFCGCFFEEQDWKPWLAARREKTEKRLFRTFDVIFLMYEEKGGFFREVQKMTSALASTIEQESVKQRSVRAKLSQH